MATGLTDHGEKLLGGELAKWQGWTLIRHKREYREPDVGGRWRSSGRPAAIFWARRTGERREFHVRGHGPGATYRIEEALEIRSPINAAGYGSEDPGELLTPEASARSGVIPRSAVEAHYETTTPEELGLTVGAR